MTVYIVQDQRMMDEHTGVLRPKFNFKPASKFGELKFLLDERHNPFQPSQAIRELREKLEGFTDEDYLLLTGNPILIGLSVAIAAEHNDGNVRMLQWSGTNRDYIPVEAQNVIVFE